MSNIFEKRIVKIIKIIFKLNWFIIFEQKNLILKTIRKKIKYENSIYSGDLKNKFCRM